MRQLYEYVANESTRSNGGKNLTIKVHRCCLKLHRSCFISFISKMLANVSGVEF